MLVRVCTYIYSYFTPTLLLFYSYFTPTLLLFYSYFTPILLLLYSYFTPTLHSVSLTVGSSLHLLSNFFPLNSFNNTSVVLT